MSIPIFASQLGKVEEQNPEKAVKTLANHLRKIQEELEYRLMNLDSDNIKEINVSDTNVLVSGQPLQNVLQDQEGNYSVLQHTVEGLSSAVADQFGQISTLVQTADGLRTQVSNMEGNVSTLTQTANGLQTQVTSLAGNVSTLQQTANGIRTSVSDLDGRLSTLTQTATGLQTKVSTLEGNYSTLTQTANGLSSKVSSLEGDMSSLEQTSNSVLSVVYDMQDDVGHMLKLDSRGVYIVDNAGNRVSIHGGQVEAGTVVAGDLMGGFVGLMDDEGETQGYITITDADTADYAVEIQSYGAMRILADGNYAALWLEAGDAAHLAIRTVGNNGYHVVTNRSIVPSSDGSCYVGTSYRHWAGAYFTACYVDGEAVTSDRNRKHDIVYGLDRFDQVFDGLQPVTYKLNNGTSNRDHIGLVAQDVEALVTECGFTGQDIGVVVREIAEDGTESYYLRYTEFIGLLIDQVQKLKARVAGLEGKKK